MRNSLLGWKNSAVVTRAAVAIAVIALSCETVAGSDAQDICQRGRYYAAARYEACQRKAAGKFYLTNNVTRFWDALRACVGSHAIDWPKLQARAVGSGTMCDGPRFVADATTVTDNLTGLQWEIKTDDDSVHDKDNVYTWSVVPPAFSAANGTAFTIFLASLNDAGAGCFAGHCDWRLPTFAELASVLLCSATTCWDPVFGLSVANLRWSASTYPTAPGRAWSVSLFDGSAQSLDKYNELWVRAVRGGL